jgi:phosphatidate cytidylyltransferase
MTTWEQTVALFGGIGALLVIASAVGFALDRKARRAGVVSATIENLNARIRAWWVMVVVATIAFMVGRIGIVVLGGLCSFLALREMLTLVQTRRGDHFAIAGAFFIVLPAQYVLIGIDWYGLYSIFIPVYAFLAMPIVAALRSDTTRFLERISETQWGLMVCVYCVSHVPALMLLPIPGYEGRELLLIAFLVIVVQASDVLQYIWGKLLGRHKIAPLLSPSKTVEGFVGGVASASLLGAALWWITPFTPVHAGIIALLICLMGFCGGLVMSAIKRDLGVKDWGSMIQGHGGILDRLDSVIFAAPIFFHVTRYWWTP